MCGIWAVFGSDENLPKQCKCMWRIAHRGPDAFRLENVTKWNQSCALGFHRLSILDSEHGMQPMQLHSLPHLRLIYNGEIYNYKTVTDQFNLKYETHCDGEVILRLYAHGGIDFAARHLDGVFAFCLLDIEKSMVYLGRDTFGVRPLFKTLTSDGFLAVCSEVKGLITVTEKSRVIETFPPGYYEEYALREGGKAELVNQVQFNDIGQFPAYRTSAPPIDNNDISGNIRNLLSSAVKKRMVSERRIGCLLSGGLDSSLITAMVVKYAKEIKLPFKIQTFSIGMHEDAPDIVQARKVAKYLDTEHHEVYFSSDEATGVLKELIYHLESYETMVIRASIGMYLLAKYIREKTDTVVVFSGEGSDELAQGYIYFHEAPSPEAADKESRRLLKDLYLHDVLRCDRNIAAHGLELRVPFLDHQFTSYYLSVPNELRQSTEGVEKYLLRSAFKYSELIPDYTLWRPKEGFSDGVATIEKSLYEYLHEFIDKQIDATSLEMASNLYPFNTPKTKEELYYREIFEGFYPGCSHLTPYYWRPKWIEASDPSARALPHYKGEI